MLVFLLFLSFIFCEKVFYNLDVEIIPHRNYLSVAGYVEFENRKKEGYFYLNRSIKIKKFNPSIKLERVEDETAIYKFHSEKKIRKIYLYYDGNFNYPLEGDDNYAKGMKITKGIISEDGCFLIRQSGWYPILSDGEIFFDITFHIPDDYSLVMPGFIKDKKTSNGKNVIRYVNKKPVFELPLTCGRYKVYSLKFDPPIYVYMINPDDEIAKKYLEYSKMYIAMYQKLIGRYPYEKFAVVENFWETGYAFPSFTLLGKSVMRFPFIFITSLPHEILHNWWGNGVYVDYDSGNWSEGITTYMADYMFYEQRGKGKEYRMSILKKYTDYLKDDIPLKDFRERHSNETEATGYGKSMMLFHMIRRDMGDERFVDSLRNFYNTYLYKKASWYDLKRFFEKYSEKDYSKLFEEFLNKKGFYSAILLKDKISVENGILNFEILNNGDFDFTLPLRLYYKNRFEDVSLKLQKGINSFKLVLSNEDLSAVCLDCEFDVLRRLSENETPPTFSKFISTKRVKVFSNLDLRDSKWTIDNDTYSTNQVYLYVGKNYINDLIGNNFISFKADEITIQDKVYDINENHFAFILSDKERYYVYVLCDEGCNEILNKLFHYGKYSYLVFDKRLNLVDSGVWHLKNRDNFYKIQDYHEEDSERKPLYGYVSVFDEKYIKKHVRYLSSKIKTRHPGSAGLEKAKNYIKREFKKIGLIPLFDGSYTQDFEVEIMGTKYILSNICGKTSSSKSYIVISAHYDHLFPKGDILYPGANDNASGVAALIEFAKIAKKDNKNGLIFCAFSGEEYNRVGSRYFLKNNLNKIYANINLDTIGRLHNNNIVVLNSESSILWKSLIKRSVISTGLNYTFSKGNITSSDDFSFIENQIPAVQIYDGSVDDYHQPTDVFSKINFSGIVRVLDFLRELVYELHKRESIPFDNKRSVREIIKKRTFSLGFAPDFTYNGEGIRIKKINPSSILLKYNFMEGDVILAINGIKIKDIFDYNSILSEFEKGQKISLYCLCGGEKKNVDVTLE